MNLWNTISIGLKEIWAHKFRSMLTMFGIILGVSSLVAMSALVTGMEIGLKEGLVAMGGMEKIRIEAQDELPVHQRHLADQAEGLRLRDVIALKEGAPLVDTVTPSIDRHGWRRGIYVSRKGKYSRPYMFSGTWPDALEIEEHVIEHGRMFNEIDDEAGRAVCVIGTGIRDDLFGIPEEIGETIIPLGEQIQINGEPFTVIGMFQHYESDKKRRERELAAQAKPTEGENQGIVAKRDRGRAGRDHWAFRVKNNTVYIPLNTMLIKFAQTSGLNETSDPRLSTINMKIKDVSLLESALQQVRNVLMMTHHGIEDFAFQTQEDWAEEITTSIKNARISGSIIAGICLIVGGIGIMNIMLASISERIREIGIRKAVGATSSAVFTQILVEAVVLSLLGGVAGLAVSIGLVELIGRFTPSDNAPTITVGAMIFAFGCSAVVGVIAGMYPALKASGFHPIQALRYD